MFKSNLKKGMIKGIKIIELHLSIKVRKMLINGQKIISQLDSNYQVYKQILVKVVLNKIKIIIIIINRHVGPHKIKMIFLNNYNHNNNNIGVNNNRITNFEKTGDKILK